jgi:DNA-binding CsgD family transcriptional regulator
VSSPPGGGSSADSASPARALSRSSRKRIWQNTGFGCALVATTLTLSLSLPLEIVVGSLGIPAPLIILSLTILLLLGAARANDLLIARHGLSWLKACIVLGGLGSLLLLTGILALVGALAAALFMTASLLLWGRSLARSERTELLLTTALSFAAAGVFIILALNAGQLAGWLIVAAVSVLSGLIALGDRNNPRQQGTSIAISRSRGSAGKGNYFTIIALGLGASTVALMGCRLPYEPLITASLMGSTMTLTSLATLYCRARFKQAYEHLARRTLAVFTSCSLLPYPFVDAPLQAVCVCVLLVSVTVNCIILIDAIAETAHLKRISPYWIIGNEGSLFMLGMLLAFAAFWYCLITGTATSATAVCLVFAVIFMVFQVFIEEQTYPYFKMQAEGDEWQFSSQATRSSDLFPGGGAKWRERLDEVAVEHKLSPRQQEVMRLLLKGRDVKYIMNKFVISQATARTHVYNLYKKLGVHSRSELMDLIERPARNSPVLGGGGGGGAPPPL